MPKRLSPEQVAYYRGNGFVAPVAALSEEESVKFRRRFEEYEQANRGWYGLSKGQKLYLLQTWARDLASHPAILDAVEDVLGGDIFLWGLSLFVKDPRDPGYVSWHQDSTYWGLSEPDVVTAWVALSPSNLESGCMKMLPGSHRLEQLPHNDTLAEHNLLTRGQEIAVEVDEREAEYLVLNPGEISLHNIRTIHGSEPNRSNERRIGVALRYIAPHVQQINAERDSAWLVRGQDRYGHFVHELPPKRDMDEAARAEHDRIMKLRQGILYDGVKGRPAHLES
ncbi:MAG: phytanoyl-CoA dioxygenase family protein [Gammaproteobacteria bacterium]|nr:phytanoyl-CoA dioxygenase family protein [Gammaproteobacteria bacterium]MDH3411623.1 phytanoyl-CoA dioxygenase family protein [Gammaproteobacteria bacterium]